MCATQLLPYAAVARPTFGRVGSFDNKIIGISSCPGAARRDIAASG